MESPHVNMGSSSPDQLDENEVCKKYQTINSEEIKKESEHLSDEFLRQWTEAEDFKSCFKMDEGEQEEKFQPPELPNDATSKQSSKESEREVVSSGITCQKRRTRWDPTFVDGLIQKLCENAEVSNRYASLCIFNCHTCNEDKLGWKSLIMHCAAKSKCHKKININRVAELITKVVSHVCLICSEKVLCDCVFLRRHLYGKHQMAPKDYVTKFALDTSNKSLEKTYSNEIIGNFCLYQCKSCEEQFKTRSMYYAHIKKYKHKKSKVAHVKVVYHQCRLCNKTGFCEVDYIQIHLRNLHGMTIDQYCKDTNCILDVTNLSINSKTIIKYSDQAIEKLCEGAPISEKVTTMCRFKCPECSEEVISSLNLMKHFKHSLNSGCHRTFSGNNIAEYIAKVVVHICKICSTKVLCDTHYIMKHLRKVHKMWPNEYKKKFCLDTTMAASEVIYSENVIGNIGLFKCETCEKEFKCIATLRRHKKKNSHKSNEKLGKKVYHKCKLCGKTLTCIKSSLNIHFKQMHGISIEDYCKNYNCTIAETKKTTLLKSLSISNKIDDLCEFSCSVCNKAFKAYMGLKIHKNTENHLVQFHDVFKHLTTGFLYKCDKCPKLLLCDKYLIGRHMTRAHNTLPKACSSGTVTSQTQYNQLRNSFLKNIPVCEIVHEQTVVPIPKISDREITSTIGDLCNFSCPQCEIESFTSWFPLQKHCKEVHKETLRFESSLVLTARYHACLLCPNAILSDRHFLRLHLRNDHRMKLTKYEQTFQKHGGKTLPSYWIWHNHRTEYIPGKLNQ